MLDSVFMQILDMTKVGSLVILAVLLARLILKRSPKILSYCLWAVVLFRLLCPVSIQLPVSLVPEIVPVSSGYSLAEEPISVAGAGMAAYRLVGDALNGGLGVQHICTTEVDTQGMARYVQADPTDVVILIGQYLWLAGLLAMLVHSAFGYLQIRRKLAAAVPAGDRVWIADDIGAPFVMGLWRPRIYLPSGLSEGEQGYVLLHERCHIRRADPFFKALAYVALCLHWFNPLV